MIDRSHLLLLISNVNMSNCQMIGVSKINWNIFRVFIERLYVTYTCTFGTSLFLMTGSMHNFKTRTNKTKP